MYCFLCGKNNFEQIYRLQSKNILRCKNDGLILGIATAYNKINVYHQDYFDNPPHPANSNYSYFLKKLETIRQALRRSSSRVKSRDSGRYQNFKPKILDIGCGWGDFEEVLEKEKIPYLGIDTSKEAIEICKKKRLNCKLSTIEKIIEINNDSGVVANAPPQNDVILASEARPESINKFDAITMFQVIEHLKNPLSLLQSAKKFLKPGGIVLITTPNHDSPLRKIFRSRWSVYNDPSHYVFYNDKTLNQTLGLAGFKNIRIKLDQMRFLSSSYILNRLKQIYFPNFEFRISNFEFSLPIPTDRWGDLEAIAVK